jgi:hypothetical protein
MTHANTEVAASDPKLAHYRLTQEFGSELVFT